MKNMKVIALGIMTLALAGLVLAVSPQLLTAQTPGTDASGTASNAPVAQQTQSDLVDSYNWKTTAGQTPKKL